VGLGFPTVERPTLERPGDTWLTKTSLVWFDDFFICKSIVDGGVKSLSWIAFTTDSIT
jgi:hypothetical protein